jgi:glycerol-3-phosphate dehydrogenase
MTKKICVLGLGYIGLPTASILATKGYSVVGVDVNPQVVETINKGRIHIVEPDLDILVKSAVHSGNLTASSKPREADVFIIAVPTPFKKDKKPDLTYVMFPYDEAEKGLISAGLSSDMSRLYVEMSRAFNEGRVTGIAQRPLTGVTHTTFEQFCDEVFVPLFMRKKAA